MDDHEMAFTCRSPYDKITIKGRHWPVIDGDPRAVLLIVHGSGEHCQRYRHMARFFNAYQIACVGFDWRGHGESDGARGYIPCIEAIYDDLESIIALIRTDWYPNVPMGIYSHGTGSLICLSHMVRRAKKPLNCQAMIISTLSLCLRKRPTSLLLFFSRAFANLDPHFRLPVDGNHTNIYCNDPEIVKAYREDPLVHDRWPANTVSILMELGLLLENNMVNASCPILLQHGGSDTITPIAGIKKWVRSRMKGDVLFKEWPENIHELHNDLNKEDVLDYALRWLETKLEI